MLEKVICRIMDNKYLKKILCKFQITRVYLFITLKYSIPVKFRILLVLIGNASNSLNTLEVDMPIFVRDK